MSEVITVINMKGGVGKTTLSVNLSYCLSKFHDKRVLLIDMDPQFNATQYVVNQTTIIDHFQKKKTSYDILVPKQEEQFSLVIKAKAKKSDNVSLQDYIIPIHKHTKGQFDLIPSSLRFINFGAENRVDNRLRNFINNYCKHYDVVIIDCPPTLSVLTLSAYNASQYYLIPIKPDFLSSLGLPLLEQGLDSYEEMDGHTLEFLGIVFTMNDNYNLAQKTIRDIKSTGRICFQNSSSLSNKVARSINKLDDFYRLADTSRYANEFKKITVELIKKSDGTK